MIWNNLKQLLKIVGRSPWDSIVIINQLDSLTLSFQYLWCTHLTIELDKAQADKIFKELVPENLTSNRKWDMEWNADKAYQLSGNIIHLDNETWKIAFHRLNFNYKGKISSLTYFQDSANSEQLLFSAFS